MISSVEHMNASLFLGHNILKAHERYLCSLVIVMNSNYDAVRPSLQSEESEIENFTLISQFVGDRLD